MIRKPKIGRYEVVAALGGGRFGDVFLAWDPLLQMQVALKRSRAPASEMRDALLEARLIATLNHPNIVRFYTAEIVDDYVVLVLEYVPGNTLRQMLRRMTKTTEAVAVSIVGAVLEGLAYAHELGVLHRDIKPENILVGSDGKVVKLTDFGLAVFHEKDRSMSVAGTPNYMAPECWDGIYTAQSDLFSCGVILYEMTTGINPLYGETLNQVRENSRKPITFGALARDLSPRFVEAVERVLHPDPEQRVSSAREFLSLLRRDVKREKLSPPVIRFDWSAATTPEETLRVLSEQQRAFVEDPARRIALFGGPGTGKTFSLAAKVIYLIYWQKVLPERIAVTTFTAKAWKDLAFRLERALGACARSLALGNFHSLCWKILASDAERLPQFSAMPPIFEGAPVGHRLEIIPPDKLYEVAANVARDINATRSGRYLYDRFCRFRLNRMTREEVAAQPLGDLLAELLRFWDEWENQVVGSGRLTYDDVLYYTYVLLRQNPDVAAEYQEQFAHFFVDEYQDFTAIQVEILKMLVGENTQWVVAGDPAQSIYSWRGASPAFLRQFAEELAGDRVYNLNVAFRLPQKIVKLAQNLMSDSGLVLPGNFEDEGTVEVVAVERASDIGDFVAREIKKLRAEGFSFSDIAVLYRFTMRSRPIEEALAAAGIPYSLMFTRPFYRRPEVEGMLNLLRMVLRPDDDEAFAFVLRWLYRVNIRDWQRPRRSRNGTDGGWHRLNTGDWPSEEAGRRGSVEQERPESSEEGDGRVSSAIGEPVSSGENLPESPGEGNQAVSGADAPDGGAGESLTCRPLPGQNIRNLVEHARRAEWGHSASQVLRFLASHLRLIGGQKKTPAGENVEELIRAAADYERRAREDASIAGFLNHLEFLLQSDPEEGAETVNLATVHSAKGLEFPVVFLVGLVEGEFPVNTVKPMEIEEERRLFLVGVTRARSRLYFCYHKRDDDGRGVEPSRFIRLALTP